MIIIDGERKTKDDFSKRTLDIFDHEFQSLYKFELKFENNEIYLFRCYMTFYGNDSTYEGSKAFQVLYQVFSKRILSGGILEHIKKVESFMDEYNDLLNE